MTLQTFLSYFASILGLSASIFFIIGTLTLTPKKIAELSGTYWNCNSFIATAFASQRLDYTCGAILLFLSFVIQISSLYQVDQQQPLFFQTPIRAISFLLIFSLACILITLLFRKLFSVYLNRQVNRELKKP